ncbi:MAG: transporter substrate-binding domain-containing protein [Alphaproteobacteria bacterium]|nr:transporter substrate-binding domain-containing protein [Alphaproteobacteria bacterium]
MTPEVLAQLAPTGTLRVGLNMANNLLNTSTTTDGEPDGVASDMGRAIAEKLGVGVAMVQYASPGEIADTAGKDGWDLGMIGAEPKRAEVIDFSAAYVEIEATYLVPAGSLYNTIDEIDQEGIRIAVSGRSAYDLYLSQHLNNAELVRAQGVAGAVELFKNEGLEALAGLRPALVVESSNVPGSKILDGGFTSVQQAIGVTKGYTAAAEFVAAFVEESKANGFIASLIEKHGVTGRLSVGSS